MDSLRLQLLTLAVNRPTNTKRRRVKDILIEAERYCDFVNGQLSPQELPRSARDIIVDFVETQVGGGWEAQIQGKTAAKVTWDLTHWDVHFAANMHIDPWVITGNTPFEAVSQRVGAAVRHWIATHPSQLIEAFR